MIKIDIPEADHLVSAWAEIFAAAHELVNALPHRIYLDFVAHGMGLVSHEAARLIQYEPRAYDGCK
jgi:hypothetical protein